jgi:hypothetical protein
MVIEFATPVRVANGSVLRACSILIVPSRGGSGSGCTFSPSRGRGRRFGQPDVRLPQDKTFDGEAGRNDLGDRRTIHGGTGC